MFVFSNCCNKFVTNFFYRSLFADSYVLHLPLFGRHPSCVPCVRGWWRCHLCGMTHSSTAQRTHITWLCPVTVQSSEDSLQDTAKHNSVWVTSTLTMSLIPLPVDSISDTLWFTRLCLICSTCQKLLSFIPRFIPTPTKKTNPKTDLSAGLRKETPDRVLRYLLEKWDKSKGIIL